jgi:predicted MFS family arabinose efflux permease
VINQVDRQVLAVLLEPIKRDLGASDTAMGLLTGLAFAFFYTTAGIPIARLADRGSRRNVIVAGVAMWSVMTAFCGITRSFAQLAAARIGVGVGEAALGPAANSLISDYFPPERRATALAIYNIGGNVGVMVGFIAGGWIGQTFGWRAAFLIVGLPGLAAALLTRLTLREPPRGLSDAVIDNEPVPRLRETISILYSNATFRHLSLSSAFYAFAAYGFTVWGATFLIRVHGMSLGETGLWLGLIQGFGGGLGTYVGGHLSDRFASGDARIPTWVSALGGVLAVPALLVFLFAPNPSMALAGYAPAMAFSLFFVGPSYSIAQRLVRLRLRAQATAFLMLNMNLIGLGIAPLVVGALNDVLTARFGDMAIRYSLLVAGLTSFWAVGHSLMAARTIRRDLAATK